MSLVAENYIDLKPDSSLLDVNFSGYKLSLDTFPSFDVQLPAKSEHFILFLALLH